MKFAPKSFLCFACIALFSCMALAQNEPATPAADVVRKSIKAVGYEVGGGSTKIAFVGTSEAPNASGEAKVDAKTAGTNIELKVTGLPQPTTFGGNS